MHQCVLHGHKNISPKNQNFLITNKANRERLTVIVKESRNLFCVEFPPKSPTFQSMSQFKRLFATKPPTMNKHGVSIGISSRKPLEFAYRTSSMGYSLFTKQMEAFSTSRAYSTMASPISLLGIRPLKPAPM